MTPFEPTTFSVTLNAAVIVPSANKRFPAPNVTGYTISQNASIKLCLISVRRRSPLPQTCRSGPCSCLGLATFSGISPFNNTDGCHLLEVLVFEATYLVAVLTPGHSSACCGQNGSQMSKVMRPNNKSNGMFICLLRAVPRTSSEYGAIHPPYAKPPLVSSSGPPGACMTPSMEICSSTVSFLMSILLYRIVERVFYFVKTRKPRVTIVGNQPPITA